MTKQKFANDFFKSLNECRDNQILCDVCLRVKAYNPDKATVTEELIYAHRIVLAVASPLFRQMVTSEDSTASNTPPVIDLNLPPLPQSIETFKAMLDYLYSGEINLNTTDTLSMLQIAQMCQVASLETKIMNENLMNNNNVLTRFLQNNPLRPVPTRVAPVNNNPLNMYLQSLGGYLDNPMMLQMLQPWANPLNGMFFPQNQSMNVETEKTETESDRSPAPSGSSPRSPSAPFDNMGDVIVPSNDKEGWCRNKKYIERVPNGFMCTVCRKIYGRYNSVSYHVTIYHRNPPIRCDEEGCSFTTREARYIHFHKYYRHHIPLPQSIDLGSRKCPFCRHVSKSPAMLEKHINRHIPECARVGQQYKCPQCPQTTDTQKEMFDHIMLHQDQETKAPLLSPPCSVKDEDAASDESPIDLTAAEAI